jgi:hypothetical protein
MRTWPYSHFGSFQLYGHCLDLQTEVLTRDGWKKRGEINRDDSVVTLNIENHQLELNSIEEIIDYNHTGETISILSKGLDLNVTPNHTLIEQLNWRNSGPAYRKFSAGDTDKLGNRVFIKAGLLNKDGLSLSDDLLRLMVWTAADGSLCNSSLIRFGLYKERKIYRLEELLSRLGIQYRKLHNKAGGYSINFTRPKELDGFGLKPLDKEICNCNENQTEVVLREYAETDGHTYGRNDDVIQIWTSKKVEADIIQIMCITNGYQCNISTRVGHGFSRKLNYTVTVTKGIFRNVSNISSHMTRNSVVNESYWCLQVKNGTLFVRRNGKPVIVGNSHGNLPGVGRQMDVGVDTNNFYPYSLDDIVTRLSKIESPKLGE